MEMELGGALCRTQARAGVESDENARPGGASTPAPAEPGAAYRLPLRAIQPTGQPTRRPVPTPNKVGAVTTPLCPTDIPRKPKPVQVQRSKVTGSILLQRSKISQKRKTHELLEMSVEDADVTICSLEAKVKLLEEEAKQRRRQQEKLEVDLQNARQQLLVVLSCREAKSSLEDTMVDSLDPIRHRSDGVLHSQESRTGKEAQVEHQEETGEPSSDECMQEADVSDLKRSLRQLFLSFLKSASDCECAGHQREESKSDSGASQAFPGCLRIGEGCCMFYWNEEGTGGRYVVGPDDGMVKKPIPCKAPSDWTPFML